MVHVPVVFNVNGPLESKFHVDKPDTAGEIVNALGAAGVTLLLAALDGPVPVAFVAVTVKV